MKPKYHLPKELEHLEKFVVGDQDGVCIIFYFPINEDRPIEQLSKYFEHIEQSADLVDDFVHPDYMKQAIMGIGRQQRMVGATVTCYYKRLDQSKEKRNPVELIQKAIRLARETVSIKAEVCPPSRMTCSFPECTCIKLIYKYPESDIINIIKNS